jgi:hypothetical protein
MSPSEELEARIDEILAASFPASDPPPWTTGVDAPHTRITGPLDPVREQPGAVNPPNRGG